MKKSTLLSGVLLILIAAGGSGQTPGQKPRVAPMTAEELLLLSELQSLGAQSAGLGSPLSVARAKAEVASALWYLDEAEAKRMLIEAFELALPPEEEREKSRARAIGGDLGIPGTTEMARGEIRRRVMQIAGRDQAFAKQMVKMGNESLGGNEAHLNSVAAGKQALLSGDLETAGKYIADAIEAEPTQTAAAFLIQEVAKKDRAAADALTIKYIDRLRAIPFSFSGGTMRIYFNLFELVFPRTLGTVSRQAQVPPPGPAVMRAYAGYVVQSIGQLRQSDPSGVVRLRNIILTAGNPVRQYAPELMPAYLELERVSRGGAEGEPFQTPEQLVALQQRNQQKLLDAALDKDTIDASLIEPAVRRGMFDKARRAARDLPDGERKTQFMDLINAEEVASLLAKNNVAAAESLADQLRTPPRILDAYLALANRCGDDQSCKIPLLYKALTKIKAAESTLPIAPGNQPALSTATPRESDTRLSSLSKLAVTTATLDDGLAQTALNDLVTAINRTTVDSSLGRLGFEVEPFRLFAQKSASRAQTAALGLTDPLRRIAALSAIDELKARELKKKNAVLPPTKKETGRSDLR